MKEAHARRGSRGRGRAQGVQPRRSRGIERGDVRRALSAGDDTLSEIAAACTDEVREALNATLPEGQEGAAVTRITRDLLAGDYPVALVNLYAEIVRGNIRPNMLIDTEITEANRQKARESVEPEVLVKREVIVREGEIVTEAQYQMIASLGLLESDRLDVPLFGGLALLMLTLCGIIAIYLWQFDPGVLREPKRLLLLCLIIVLEVAISLVVRGINSYLMPWRWARCWSPYCWTPRRRCS